MDKCIQHMNTERVHQELLWQQCIKLHFKLLPRLEHTRDFSMTGYNSIKE